MVGSPSTWRVVKVGGSLLDHPDLIPILAAWLDAQPALGNLLIVGGGELADQIRRLDQLHHWDQEAAHWLAIRAMHLNGFVLSWLVPGARWIGSYGQWAREHDHELSGVRRLFLAVEPFLRQEEPELPGLPLPCGWHVTSDSIAARLAAVCQAQELVLLKSTLPIEAGRAIPVAQAAAIDLVDAFFPACAASLPHIRAVNLRDRRCAEIELTA
jgi:5-(aminomethyl)-3-furanmethanol phosphate kinase